MSGDRVTITSWLITRADRPRRFLKGNQHVVEKTQVSIITNTTSATIAAIAPIAAIITAIIASTTIVARTSFCSQSWT
jgi:hypothetical protein